MAQFILQDGFEHVNQQVFFTLALIDDAGREIHKERLGVPIQANQQAVEALIQAAANAFPSTQIEDVIGNVVRGLTL